MQPGHQIDHYRIIEQIGQGGQATVWSADDERLKRVVAIKTIDRKSPTASDSTTIDLDLTRRFQEEARIIADLEHPAILPVYTFGQDGEALYIVIRYMAGGSLKQLLHEEVRL